MRAIRRLWSWLRGGPYVVSVSWQNRFSCACGWSSRHVTWEVGTQMACPRCGLGLRHYDE